MVLNTTDLRVCVTQSHSSIIDTYCDAGGILPAVQEYAGTTQPVPENNTGLAFAGGSIPTYLEVDFPKGHVIQGLRHQFTLLQQGLTADVTCQQSNGTGGNVYSSFYPLSVPYPNGTTNYWLWAWNITADCSQGEYAISSVESQNMNDYTWYKDDLLNKNM